MPDLNPLKFAVAIQDEATGQLNKIEQEFQKLKDKTITVKVEGLSDLQNLLSALQHQQVQNIGKDVASGIHDAAKGLQEEAQKAVRASLGQLAADLTAVKTAIQHDNFTAFSTRIEKCAEAVNTLDAAFKQFHVTIGQDAGMKNFMTGLGEVIRNVRTSMGQLNGFGQTKTPPESVYVRNVQKMEDALYRIQEARAKVGNAIRQAESLGMPGVNNMRIYLQMLDAYEKKLQNIRSNPLMMHENGWQAQAFGTTFKHLLGNAGDFQRQVDGFVQKQNTLETNQRRFNTALEESEKLLKRLDGASTKGFALGIDTSKTDKALQDIQQFIDKLLMFDSKNLGNGHAVNELIAEYTRLKSTLSGVAREQEKLNSSTEKANKKAADNSTRKAQKDNEAWTESMRRAGVEATKLEITIRKLQEAEARGKLANVDTTNLSARIAELQNFANILRSIESGSRLHGHTSDFVNSVPFQNAIRLANEEAAAVKKSATEKEHAARAAQQFASEEQRLAHALSQVTDQARSQSQVLSDLKSMAAQYLSVYGAQQFLHNIIEIGGQLEMQRLSIAAILDDASMANELFGQVKALAVKSPFGVVQLDQDMKQLSAYGFEANELYDMTRRLADISAATGTDVSRLALALGHVRSEMALTGYTLRQFSMANVPMAKMLSEQLSEVEKRVVSVAEVRKRVRNKEIGYEEVEKVIKDLTNEGGIFYNMQEVMSESVKAKYKNLKDSLDIMYGEIAESAVGGALKKVAESLMSLTRNWEDMMTVLGVAGTLWVAQKGYTILLNTAIKQQILATKNAALANSKYTISQLRVMAAMRASTGVGKRYVGVFTAIRAGAIAAGRALTALWSKLWPVLAISAVVELFMHWKQQNEQAGEAASRAFDKASDGARKMKEALESLPEFSDSMDSGSLHQGIEKAVQYLKDYSIMANDIIAKANETDAEGNAVMSLADQYKYLRGEVEKTKEAMEEYKRTSQASGDAIAETGGFANDNVYSDLKDYFNARKAWIKATDKFYSNDKRLVESAIEQAMAADDAFRQAAEGVEGYGEKIRILYEDMNTYSGTGPYKTAYDKFRSVYIDEKGWHPSDWDGTSNKMFSREKNEAEHELDNWAKGFQRTMESSFGYDFSSLTEKQFANVRQQIWDFSNSEELATLDETTKKWVREYLGNKWGITFSVEDEQALEEVDEIKKRLDEVVNGDWQIDIKGATNIDDVISKIQKGYKSAKEWIESAPPMLIKLGITSTNGAQLWSDEFIRQKANGDPIAQQILEETRKQATVLSQALTAHNTLGIPLESPTKKKGGKNGSGSGHKAYKDEFAKRWDERIRIMKEAYDWYEKWEKKVGNDAAIAETNSKYADIFNEWRTDKLLPMDFDVNEIADYTKYVEKIRDDALKRYQAQKNDKGKNNGQEALRVYRQAVALLNDVKFDGFTRAAEEFKSIIDQTITDLNERWDMFNTVRSATGNVALASRVAGFGTSEEGARTSADAMRNELLKQIQIAGGANLAASIPLDVHLDEESIRANFESAIPDANNPEEYKKKIDGLIKAYQEWQKLQQKVLKDDVSVFANLIGSVVSYDAKVKKLRDELQQKKDSVNASLAAGVITQEDADKANNIAQTQFDWEKMKLSADYANIYNNAVAMSREEFDGAASSIERLLDKLRELELISPEDYISEKGKLDKARQEWNTTGFLGERGAVGQFITGGYDGLTNYYAQRRDNARQKAERETDPDKKKKYTDEAEHYGKLFQSMSKLSDTAKDVVTAFQTLQSGLDLVTNLFDSLGMEGAANAAGDAGGILGGAMQGASALSALGPWGMAAGAGLGLISGIAQVHDNRLERQIGKLREDVQKIEANTKLIQQARERTSGYDTGELRKSYAKDYSPNEAQKQTWSNTMFKYSYFGQGFSSKAQRDMYEYYSQNSSGTGYQQEYQNLLQQRKYYLEILDKQESKKKKSQSDIEATKGKIAELDDQIRFFSMDLAKELWDIDIKGWADQLSDALASAFENGESMAKAYKETVTSILQQVMNKMMQMAILEPMFQSLQDKLFGNAEKNITGVFNPADPQGSMAKVTAMITDFFGKGGEGEKTITAATEFMAAYQRGLQNAGLSVLNDSANTLSSSVQGTSEETSDLLAGYVNALRQDVAVNRILFTQFVTQLWPEYVTAFANHVKTVANIDVNVQVMMEMMRDGRGAMYDEIHSLRSRIDNVVDGIEGFKMR